MAQAVVIDTNVFVGALLGPGGANRQIIRLCLEGRLDPVMGAALFAEYEDVLARQDLFATCEVDAQERDELFDAFLNACRWVSIYFLWRPNLRDEADNHLVELAVAAGAPAIVTNNVADFVGEQMAFLNIRAVRPGDLIVEMERRP
ncbi:MAG: putative toxin-antitoxin system toxin component, PIN family [Hyphomicrobiales bacterium]|nr:putative toxin-antitoxin system toxin component, PIN family [Hyphomicrobiales bacterium]